MLLSGQLPKRAGQSGTLESLHDLVAALAFEIRLGSPTKEELRQRQQLLVAHDKVVARS